MTDGTGHAGPARGASAAEDLLERARIAGDNGRPAQAVALCRRALAALAAGTPGRGETGDPQPAPDRSLRVRIDVSLSYNLVELGRLTEAIDLLDGAAAFADPDHAAALQAARGLIYARVGDNSRAMADLDVAIEGLAGRDGEDLARTLLNRGVLHMMAGNLTAAQADTTRAEAAAKGAGAQMVVFMARYNLGYLRFLTGDLPGALQAMSEAEELAPDAALGVPALDRARVLLAAGLLSEAGEYVDTAIETFARNHARADLTDALLVGADIAIMTDEHARARLLARRAQRISGRRGNHAVELLARLAEQRATAAGRRAARRAGRPAGPGRSRAAVTAAVELAGELAAAGRTPESTVARLLGVEALLDAGEVATATETFRALTGAVARLPLGGRLQGHLMGARVSLAAGRRADGLRQLRRGLDDLGRFQALFGSQDLQAASAVWGRQLAAAGLRAAVDTGSPAQILQWLERARATSTRLAHLRPPADPALAADLGALRIVEAAARTAMLSGVPDREREREVAELRRRVRSRSWTLRASGSMQRPPALRTVQRLLAQAPPGSKPGVLAYFTGAEQVHVLIVTATGTSYRPVAPLPACEELVRVAASDLELLAADRIPAPLRRVAERSLATALRILSERLVEPVLGTFDGPVLVSGSGSLDAVPWSLLPALRGRAVSATASVSASVAGLVPREAAHHRGVLAVAGPEVDRAEQEVNAVTQCYSGAVSLTGDRATGRGVLDRIPAGGLLHIAAHGHHEPDSPLFSSVMLADGPLFAYDIAPNRAIPEQVVLSSCDVGRAAVRGDGEPLGLAMALLRSGVGTVIAAVAPVSDAAAAAVMTGYHDALARGAGPAAALAIALPMAGEVPAPFTCFGAGSAPAHAPPHDPQIARAR